MVHTTLLRSAVLSAAACLLACSGHSDVPIGREPDPGGGAQQGGGDFANAGAQAGGGGTGVVPAALQVRVQDDEGLTIEIVTLSCDQACADIVAVARGGNPPYGFVWEDGSTDPGRTVCLDASTTLTVEATDSGLVAGEFIEDPMTARAEVTAEVVTCGGDGDGDGGGGGGPLCVDNPSFEGTPGVTETVGFNAPPWAPCPTGTPDVTNASTSLVDLPPEPSDGATYLRFVNTNERVSQTLCEPIEAGVETHLLIDVAAGDQPFGEGAPAALQLWAGTASCDLATLLYESEPIATGEAWRTLCVSFTPTAPMTHLTLANGAGGISYLYVDHMVPVENCP